MIEYNAKIYNWPSGSGGAGSGLVSFLYDGSVTEVYWNEATVSSAPLPVALFQMDSGPISPATSTKQDEQTILLSNIYDQLHLGGNVVQYKNTAGNDTDVALNSTPGFSTPLPVGLYSSTTGSLFDSNVFNTINSKIPNLGQNTRQYSVPVVIASDQTSVDVFIRASDGVKVISNTTTTPLGANAVFTGGWTDGIAYSAIQVGVHADQDSANLGVEIQFSHDGITVDHYHQYTYQASSNGVGYTFQPEFQYFRVKYTNGSVAQTSFSLLTIMKATAVFPSQYRVEQAITGQSQALVTKGVIYGQTTGGGGGYVAAKVTPSGALVTDTTISGTVTVSGTVTANAGTNLNTSALALETGGNLETIAVAGQDAGYSGNISSGIPFIVQTSGKATLSFATTGTWVGTITVLASPDGVNYGNIYYFNNGTKDIYNSFTSNTIGHIDCAGYSFIKFSAISITGTVTVNAITSRVTGGVTINNSLPTGSNVIGSISAINNALPGGTNVIGGVTQSGTWDIGTITNPVQVKANAAGSYAEITNLTTTAQTFTKPANAVGFILETLSDNTVNVRYKIGATATTTSGMRMEPGRDTGYVPCAANISVIAESGSNQVVTVQWVLSA